MKKRRMFPKQYAEEEVLKRLKRKLSSVEKSTIERIFFAMGRNGGNVSPVENILLEKEMAEIQEDILAKIDELRFQAWVVRNIRRNCKDTLRQKMKEVWEENHRNLKY